MSGTPGTTPADAPQSGEIWADADGTLMVARHNGALWWVFGVADPIPADAPKIVLPLRRIFDLAGNYVGSGPLYQGGRVVAAAPEPPPEDYVCPSCRGSFSLPLGMTCDDHHPEPVGAAPEPPPEPAPDAPRCGFMPTVLHGGPCHRAVGHDGKHCDQWARYHQADCAGAAPEPPPDPTCKMCDGKRLVPGMVMFGEPGYMHGAGWGQVPCPACAGAARVPTPADHEEPQ